MSSPIERISLAYPQWRMGPSLRRVIWFLLVQLISFFIIFWAGIFTLIGAFWHADPNYIGIFVLLVTGFEFLTLRILVRRKWVTVVGILLLAAGIYLHHQDSNNYNERTCKFIKQSTCQEFGGGFMCRQDSANTVVERTISRDDIDACAQLDEF